MHRDSLHAAGSFFSSSYHPAATEGDTLVYQSLWTSLSVANYLEIGHGSQINSFPWSSQNQVLIARNRSDAFMPCESIKPLSP